MKAVYIIPVRGGGSKGVPKKILKKLMENHYLAMLLKLQKNLKSLNM